MSEIYEHKYLVFSVSDGPKVINESLNTYGQEGWRLTTMITVGEGHLVAWVVKGAAIEAPDPKTTTESKISELWSGEDKPNKGGKKE
tara:strand:+ start:30853 stop:31113 length:261 start_codon:yes stop_codon:yes gene_type:complete